jgi:hypothetical protein
MIRIELTDADAARLREMCESQLSDLRMEIAGTDSMDFRVRLKQDAELLRKLIAQLEAARAA